MAGSGIRLTDKTPIATVAEVIGIRRQGTTAVGPIAVDDFAEQLLADGPIADQFANVAGSYDYSFALVSDLTAGLPEGKTARVYGEVDPEDNGVYKKVSGTPVRLGPLPETDLSSVESRLDAVEEDKADDTAVVKLSGAQTVDGVKTFSSAPAVPDASFSIAKTTGLQTALDAKAADSEVVKLTGGQTVDGIKTFSSAPVVPDASFAIAKTSGLQLALNAKQVSAEKGAPDGYAPLGPDSKVPEANQSGVSARSGSGDAGKTVKTDPVTGFTSPTFLDPMPARDQIHRRAGSAVAAVDPLPVQDVNGYYVTIDAGVGTVSQITLNDGAHRILYMSTNLVFQVAASGNNTIRGDLGGENISARNGDLVDCYGEANGVVRIRVRPSQRSVLESAGAASAGSVPRLDLDGKTDFSTQPKQYKKLAGTGGKTPLWAIGGKYLGLFALYADGSIKNPMLNGIRKATATLKIRTKRDGLLWAAGGKGKGLLGLRKDGELVNKTMSRVQAQAKWAQAGIDVWCDGDSRSDLGINPGRTTTQGWQWWTQMATGGRVRFQDTMYGLGGSNSQQILESAGALWGAKPGWVVCFISINDPPEGNGAAWTLERILAYRDRVLKMGHRVVFVAETPKGDPNAAGTYYAGFTGSQLRHHLSDRAALLQQATIAGCYVIDTWLDYIDPLSPNAKAKAGLLREGLHDAPPGARVKGMRIAQFFNHMLPERSFLPTTVADLFHATEYVQGSLTLNPLFLTTGGTGIVGANCTGTVADGWEAVAGSGLTGACSVGAAASGFGNHQQIVVGGTGPTSVETSDNAGNLDPRPISVVLQQTIMDTTLGIPLNPGYVVEGDSFQAMCHLEADAGIADVRGCGLFAWYTTAAGTFISAAGEPAVTRPTGQANLALPNVAFSGPMITMETRPIVGTPTKAGVFWALTGVKYASGVAIPASGTFRISQCKTQKVINSNPL